VPAHIWDGQEWIDHHLQDTAAPPAFPSQTYQAPVDMQYLGCLLNFAIL